MKLGIAIGPHHLTALIGSGEGARALTVPLTLPPGAEDPAPTLLRAFQRLGELGFGGEGVGVTVALLPPLVETRLLPLPPLRPEEAEAVLRRDLPKHFLLGSAPAVVGVEIGEGRGAGRDGAASSASAPGLLLAAAAPRALAEAILRASAGMGWRLEGIVPAHSAWLAALREANAATAGAPALLVALLGGTAHLLTLEGDRPIALRRLPTEDPAELLRAAGPGPGRAWVFGEGEGARGARSALEGAGWSRGAAGPSRTQMPSHTAAAADALSAAALAALHAPEARLELVPPTLALARRERLRRVGIGLGVAAVLLILASAGVQLWGASRELRLIRSARADLAEAVTPVLAAADSLALLEERLASIAGLEAEAGGWTFALVELAVVLPEDVHLSSLRAAGDTLILEAIGGRAGDALDALRSASSLREVRLEGPIQRDLEDGASARERFTLSALRAEDLPPAVREGSPERSPERSPGRTSERSLGPASPPTDSGRDP